MQHVFYQAQLVLFFRALISADKIFLGFGILQLESVMISVSNIAGMRIKRNCLFQLAFDALRDEESVISERNFLLSS